MSYAVRNDGQGWRAVSGPKDVGTDEWYSEEQPPDPVPLPLTQEEIITSVLVERDRLLALAAMRIAPLQYAVDIDIASTEEKATLLLWKKYSIEVNRISLQEGFPEDITWPTQPLSL